MLHDCALTMSLPGLNISAPVQEVKAPVAYDLREGTEWRFEVAFGTKVEVKVGRFVSVTGKTWADIALIAVTFWHGGDIRH